MKALSSIFLLIVIPAGAAAATSDIGSPQKRMVTVDLARTLLTTKPYAGGPDYIARHDPFNPMKPVLDAPVTKSAAGAPVQLVDRDLLVNIASTITPSGTIKVGDTQILLLSQKRLKVGDSISIVFQGVAYELQITGIERTSFTLRLNQEEITRPIKSVNKL
jgi:hypothetical protein